MLYYIHDLVSYQKLFMSVDESDEFSSPAPSPTLPVSADEIASMSSRKKFAKFERLVFKMLFNLSQDQNQFGYYVRALGSEPLLTNPSYLATKSAITPKFTPLNYTYFKLKANLDKSCLFEADNRQLVFFNKIVFIQRGVFLTLSEAPHNVIKVKFK